MGSHSAVGAVNGKFLFIIFLFYCKGAMVLLKGWECGLLSAVIVIEGTPGAGTQSAAVGCGSKGPLVSL